MLRSVFRTVLASAVAVMFIAPATSARAQESVPIAPELTGLGTLHMPVTTSVPQAQRFFDQGLRLLYAFNHAEAIRAFREAARLDPGLAMAHWGRAIALGPNLNAPMTQENGRQAYAAIRQARALSSRATPREQALIEALSLRYAADGKGDRAALDRAYAGAMQKAADRFEDDPDVQTLFADAQMNTMPWDYWQKDGTAKPETARILTALETVIARQPDHAGALHYHLHLLEASADPDRAAASADRLGSLMPAAGHMVHMPAHIYIRVGRYADAAEANVRAIAADEDYLAQCQAQGLYPVSYYPHNLHFLWAAATFEGRRAVAVDTARRLAEKVPHHHAGALAWTADYPVTPLLAYARFGMWQELLTEPKPPANEPYAIGVWHYGRGLAFVARGRVDAAATELTSLKAVMKHQAFTTTLKDLPMLTNLQIASRILDGELGLRRGNPDAAIAVLGEAVTIEDGIPYNEPPVWHHPPRQILGAVLLEAGRPAEAEAVYREDLKRFRENGWSLFGLAKSLEAQHKSSEALEVRRRFETAWKRADIRLTSSRVIEAVTGPAEQTSASGASRGAPLHAAKHVDLRDGTRLAYVEQGDTSGVPVILLHGYTDSWRSYERVLPHLPQSLRVLAVTQRGHGDSGKPDGEYESRVFARDVANFMDTLGIERAVIVGHSMGATVAQRFVVDYPQRVRALVLEGAFFPRPANTELRKFLEEVSTLSDPIDPVFVRDFQKSTLAQPVPPEFFDTVVGEAMKVPARVWRAALQPYLAMDFSTDLANIAVPTLLVWGDRDAFTGRSEQDDLSRAIKTSRLVVYEGAGHSPHWEEPQRFAGQVASFVAGLQGESAGLHTGAVSPLMIAVWNGQTEVVRTLLEEGADPNQPFGKPGLTAWQVAIMANHQPSLELFASYGGSRPKSHYTTALFKAALQRGDRRLVAEFVRNGASFWFGDAEYSPLGVAAANGYVDVLRALLDAGAPIDYQDRFGDTALMAAVRSGKVDAVRLLLDRGAKTSIADAEGMTALAWAERMRRHPVIDVLAPASRSRKSHHDRPLIPSHGSAVREAASRSLALLERNGSAWLEQQRCASCHHQGLLLPVVGVARRQGFAVDETHAHAQEVRLRTFVANYEPAMHATHEGGDEALVRFSLGFFGQMTSGSALLIAALMTPESGPQALEVLATDAAARTQLPDGRWRVGAPRIPIEESDFQTTALMIRALMMSAPRSVETAQRVARARLWLVSAPATTSVEKAYRLLGLHWSDADAATIRDAGQALLDAQDETGGWAQVPGLNADAYATGLALVALRETQGLSPSHTGYRRGVRFLVRTQQPDGSWFVHKRAASFNMYFESGFPYGKHQFSSFTGTAWATMALMYASQPEEKRHVATPRKQAPRT